VILNKAKEFLLVGKISTQVKANALWVVVFKPVIESLVVTDVESLLVKLPLQTPVGSAMKSKPGCDCLMAGITSTSTRLPAVDPRGCSRGALDDRIQQKHRHIAANTVTLTGYS